MSLLLDALNKADQERKRNEATPGINSNHENLNDDGSRNKSIFVIAAIVIGLVLLLAVIYWLGQRSAAPATAVTATSAAAKSSSAAPSQKSIPAAQVAPIKDATPPAEDIDTSEENVANLYQQNTATQIPVPSPVQAVPPTDNSAPANTNNEPAAAPKSITQFANLPDLHDLPSQVLEKIPSLNYSEHNYNNNGGSVKINGTIHHTNDQLANGLVIDKILEDGMILHMDNYSFKMRALNSWINM